MPTVVDWVPAVDPADLVPPVRDALAAGGLVVLPGDVGYVVLAAPGPGLVQLVEENRDFSASVLVGGLEGVESFGASLSGPARRLLARAWPAPLTVAAALPAGGAPAGWTADVLAAVGGGRGARFRSPDHPLFDTFAPLLSGSVAVIDTHLSTAGAVLERLGGRVGCAVSAGERRPGAPSEIVVNHSGWELVKAGELAAPDLEKLAARIVLFVCTGNTCRSPLAEALAKKMLADRLNCGVDELPARGFWALSAGVSAYAGGPATPESATVAEEFGADLRGHRSRPLNPQLLAAADDVIAMTGGHAYAIQARYPGVGPGPRLLCGEGCDLDDPIGAGIDVYRACATTIRTHLGRFIEEWLRP